MSCKSPVIAHWCAYTWNLCAIIGEERTKYYKNVDKKENCPARIINFQVFLLFHYLEQFSSKKMSFEQLKVEHKTNNKSSGKKMMIILQTIRENKRKKTKWYSLPLTLITTTKLVYIDFKEVNIT